MTTTVDPRAEAERVKALLVHELQRRFTYTAQDEHVQTVAFCGASLVEDTFLLLEIDCARIPRRWTVRDMDNLEMLTHLSAVCGHQVKKLNSVGLTYAVRLTPKERRAPLPARWELDAATRPPGALLIPLGAGNDGLRWAPLPELGHVLISGTTGSGKSTWLQSALCCLLATETPGALQVALIDGKRTELGPWQHAPHVLGFASDGQGATAIGERLLELAEDRAALLEAGLFRSLEAYNRKAAEPLPYVLLVIDELFDVVADAGEPFALALARLTSKGRALGVFVWATAQFPRWDVVDKRMAANMQTRLVFRVVDRRAAELSGCPGAERIPIDRPGRYVAAIGGQRTALQAPFVSERTLRGTIRSLGAPRTKPTLPEGEQRLAELVLGQLGGAFVVDKVYDVAGPQGAGGFSRRWLKETAQTWERRGYLVEDRTDPMHPRRMATEALRNALGTTEHGGTVGTSDPQEAI